MSEIKTKSEAIARIQALMEDFHITSAEIGADPREKPPASEAVATRQAGIIKRLLSYTGGIFIFSGIGLLANMVWSDITSLQRVIITFGTGLIAFILAWMAAGDERFQKAATPLFLIAAVFEIGGLFVFLDEYFPPSGRTEFVEFAIFAVIGLQMAAAFYALNRSSTLFLVLACSQIALGRLLAWLDFGETLIVFIVGLSTLLLSFGIDKTAHRTITPFWYFLGGALLLWACWDMIEGTPLDLAFLGINAFLIYVSILAASRALLFVSVLGLIAYLGYFTEEYFADTVGWPVALILMGLVMIGISIFAVRIGQKMTRS